MTSIMDGSGLLAMYGDIKVAVYDGESALFYVNQQYTPYFYFHQFTRYTSVIMPIVEQVTRRHIE